jgi:hypothetical protein
MDGRNTHMLQVTSSPHAELHGPDKEKPFYIPPDKEYQKKEFVEL